MNVDEILKKNGTLFSEQNRQRITLTVVIEVDGSFWHITIEGETVTVLKSSHPHLHVILMTTSDTMQRIYCGEMTALTLRESKNVRSCTTGLEDT